MTHRVTCKVYYEDTDCLGVVYHASYLRFMERGRSELISSNGKTIAEWNQEGYLLVVHSMTIGFRRAAVLGDVLDVASTFTVGSPFRGTFHQQVLRGSDLVVEATADIVCLDRQQQLVEFPPGIRALATPSPRDHARVRTA